MFKRTGIIASAALTIAVCMGFGQAKAGTQPEDPVMTPANVKWVSCGVPEFPGCEAAILHGDPGKGPYSMYVRLPAGAAFHPHWHSNPHYLVGVAGTLTFGYKDGTEVPLSPGTFTYWPGNELMMGRCTSTEACVYYDHQNGFGDVHFPTEGTHHN